jgi:hypothetical protein
MSPSNVLSLQQDTPSNDGKVKHRSARRALDLARQGFMLVIAYENAFRIPAPE